MRAGRVKTHQTSSSFHGGLVGRQGGQQLFECFCASRYSSWVVHNHPPHPPARRCFQPSSLVLAMTCFKRNSGRGFTRTSSYPVDHFLECLKNVGAGGCVDGERIPRLRDLIIWG